MKLLFVCSRNKMRSPTAEAIFSAYEGVEVLSGGTAPDAESPVSAEMIAWADLIFAMESVHQRRLQRQFGPLLREKRVVVLNIPDNYRYMEQELVRILAEKVRPHLKGKSRAGDLSATKQEPSAQD
jgi:predicted protein tyrosine phosphatase